MRRERFTLVLMCATVLALQALVAGINLAIPRLAASSLHPGPGDLVWIVDAYVLAFAGLLIPAGALGDRLGRKGVLLAGLVLFGVANLISASAQDVAVLQAGRALGGVAAALAQPATLALLLHATRPERRPHAIALWTACMGLGGMAGNLIAGVVLQYSGWPVLFLVFVPVAALLTAGVAVCVPRAPRHDASIDPLGTALLTGGLFAWLYGIVEGPERGWADTVVLSSFAAGALTLAAFTGYALRAARPLIDPRVFRVRTVRAGAFGVGATFFALFGLFYVNAQFLQDVKGYSPLLTGLAIGPLAIGMGVVSRRAVPLTQRYGPRPMIAIGLGAIVAGLLLLSTVDAATAYPVYAGYLLLMAAGMGLCAPALTGGILAGLPAANAGLGSGLNSAAREVGAALGVALIGTVLAEHHALRSPADLVSGLTVGYRILAAILAAAAVIVVRTWPAPAHRAEPVAA
ncbi:MFS transporter [Actinoplanes sp. SE50]|uniref:MFS transporter n=1 Tax=unclassified Actinoplanes TaxID=2626549 RepID=UPI00023ED11F|nr:MULTISPECIES: MFS transporter [unclassified Actinoplanes]AEV87258.1 Putative multidrug resistance protein mdtD [Actinoplanes sp. SE50/110]ATO85658.1 MFS transporter [Actinoplanes sp. SE50]SLM03071.1 MFS transporter [Actinoplanes sp. SE50/110]